MINRIKKVAAIHDISGLGRCSLTAAIPILSVLGVQVCPFPTAVLSCQTGYEKFSFLDLTNEMINYKEAWKDMNFNFECIYTGFLGGINQIEIILEFINSQRDSLVLVDPVMGDHGEVFKTFSKEMCNKIRDLVKIADVITPNLTEACILTEEKYSNEYLDENYIKSIAKRLTNLGPKKVVITGIRDKDNICNVGYDKESEELFIIKNKYINESFSGTGDILSSIICGMLMKKYDFKYSVECASDFVNKVINNSKEFIDDPENGVAFEPFLGEILKF